MTMDTPVGSATTQQKGGGYRLDLSIALPYF
jgi:hypothetical protein